jgi:hypothetical protein
MNDFDRLLRTAARVSRTRYPGFIFGLPLPRGEIPIFTYHDVETQVFARFDIYDWPMRTVDGAEELGRPAPGTPVYRSMPLLSATRRFVENSEVTRACRELVQRCGGKVFARPLRGMQLSDLHRMLSAVGRKLTGIGKLQHLAH